MAISGFETYILSFIAESPGGLTGMTLQAQGSPVCGNDNGTGGNFTIGNHTVILPPPQSANFNPTVTSNSLLITGFNFFKLDCNAKVVTDNGTKEAFAQSGTITLTGTATDTSGRTTTGTLQVHFP
jgi:hypothetical protein